ncbi:MAG: hypothetical protein Fur0042_21430 [Cyanophyceae cyanobacterium]
MDQPRVSVIVPIYNGVADLPDLLDGLLRQTYPADRVEFLLVDNNSRDRSFEVLKGAIARFGAARRSLRPLQELAVQSSYGARNCGIRAAAGEILAFTDGDCRPEPQWIEQLVAAFGDESVGMVAGEIRALPGDSLLERYAERQGVLSQTHTLAHSFLPYGQTANLAVRRRVFEEIGLFRPHLTTGGDADLCWRMQRETTWKLVLAAEAIVRHRHRATWAEFASQWRRYGTSNRYLHELHGVPLMGARSRLGWVRSGGRWLLKEVPKVLIKTALGRSSWTDLGLNLAMTPIGLLGARERWRGQRGAVLPEVARQVEWLPRDRAPDTSPKIVPSTDQP